ncbi:DsbA family protein [Nonomuraea sp. NPDC050556]|uniref:DsbA family protein n=1 Tax=Nonomuraea sp. NPDC050556 TaxID=3364369 RepID=UPI0037AA8DDD
MGKAEREKSARDRIKEQQAADRAAEKRKRLITYVAVGVVAVAAIGAGWYMAYSSSKSEAAGEGLPPATVNADGSVSMGQAGVAKPVVDIYEDFQCPACKQLEEVSGTTFRNLALEGKAKVVYHPITIFSQEPTKSNSIRAGAAARCVSDGKQWLKYHDTLFKNQPDETVEGFKIPDLVAWGKADGVTAEGFDACVTTQKHAAAQAAYSEKINKEQKIEGTPTVKLNGVVMDNETAFSPKQLRQAVLDAAK